MTFWVDQSRYWSGHLAAIFAVVFLGHVGVAHGRLGNVALGGTGIAAGCWRITHAVVAPWAHAGTDGRAVPARRDRWVRFHRASVDGPGALNCAHAVFEPTHYPAEGLFQGNLPAPAMASARTLGIARLPLAGVRVTCDTGVFEFHRIDADTLLLGLDNRVFTLSRAPGALAGADAPEGRVQRLLEGHFSGDMAFFPASVEAKRRWLSARLARRIAGYFARPAPESEVPDINGDPFTDSQEYPARFAVGRAVVADGVAEVPVHFADAERDRTLVYRLLRERGEWRLDDLRYASGMTLHGLLRGR